MLLVVLISSFLAWRYSCAGTDILCLAVIELPELACHAWHSTMPFKRLRPTKSRSTDRIVPQIQSYNLPSPNEMVVDTGDYIGVGSDPEKEPVAIINPDNLENEVEQLQDLPLANDREWFNALSHIQAAVLILPGR